MKVRDYLEGCGCFFQLLVPFYILAVMGIPIWLSGVAALAFIVWVYIYFKVQEYRDKLCPLCGQRSLKIVDIVRRSRVVLTYSFYLCESCGARISRYGNGISRRRRWEVVEEKGWEQIEELNRRSRIVVSPLYNAGKVVNSVGDEVVAYHIIDADNLVLIWCWHDIQTIGVSVLSRRSKQIAKMLRVLEKAEVPQIFVDKSALEGWVEQWNEDKELRACLEQSPNIGADFVGPAVVFDSEPYDVEAFLRNCKAVACLWQLHENQEVRQAVLQLAAWSGVAYHAHELYWKEF